MNGAAWENYLIGDEPCTCLRINQCLSNSTSVSLLWQKLPDVGRTLGFEGSNRIVSTVLLGIKSHSGYLEDILKTWRQATTNNATLGNLVTVLRNHHLNECAEALINEFR
ncbi:unnamed protein product [Orchesella dallaii]|uniref:Death domain-containing protein n=1 Tax=Orchesella dallaii TaxID=48710 RepID=A0ABP1RAS2_9HEXA